MIHIEREVWSAAYGAAFATNPSPGAAAGIANRAVLGLRAEVAGKHADMLLPVAEGNITPPEPEEPADDGDDG